MTTSRQDLHRKLRQAVQEAGGQSAVAKRAGLNRTHLANVLSSSTPLGRETAARLKPHINLDADVWVALLLSPCRDERQA